MKLITPFLQANLLAHPIENGITTFLCGTIFILCAYHFFLFFQQRIITYLYYSAYLFFLFISIVTFTNGFLLDLSNALGPALENIVIFSAEIAFGIYFLFAMSFLNMEQYLPKWNKRILRATYIFGVGALLFEIAFLVTGDSQIARLGYTILMIFVVPVMALISYYPIFKSRHPLRYYIVTGSLLLFLSSVVTDAVAHWKLVTGPSLNVYYSVFFICIIIENILFSLGLGHKQKLILKQNEEAQEKIITQYRENEKLKETVQQKLEENLRLASEKAERESIERLKANYEKELAELKITALKSQMNPHFIFNSLNSIKLYIIDNDKDNAVYYLNKFSKLIRKILASTRVKTVSLAEELEILELYVGIENIRFENKMNLEITLDPELNAETIYIPSLIFQPFVENAIWHGLPSKKGEKNINLNLKSDGKFLNILIEDNGIGRKKAAELKNQKLHKKKSVGIKLTKERLKNFSKEFSNNFYLGITDLYDDELNPRGTRVQLKIPLN